ncbi:MAG: hypothetical protein WB579_02970 [Bryobacteraceae bacterium]
MKNDQIDTPAAASALNLGQWLGRREICGAIAGRCSAAEIECVRRIRNERLYRGHAATWREFCLKYLGASRNSVEANIRLFDELGPAYFHVAQLAHITPAQYRQIAPRIDAEGLEAGGETIPLVPANRDRLVAVIGEVRHKARKAGPAPKPRGFEAALEHCQAAAGLLETLFSPPPFERQLVMVATLNRIRDAAARLGILGPGAQVPPRR